MNFVKLLGAGKSFVSGRKPSAYRPDKRVYLPQFGSPKNPFTGPATDGVPAESPKAAAPISPGPVRKTSSAWAEPKKGAAPNQQNITRGPVRRTIWGGKFNPVSIFRPVPEAPPKHIVPVQVELTLETVKVVHNDLTDADVEVVPMKSRPAREPAEGQQPAGKSWADLGQRILKATAL